MMKNQNKKSNNKKIFFGFFFSAVTMNAISIVLLYNSNDKTINNNNNALSIDMNVEVHLRKKPENEKTAKEITKLINSKDNNKDKIDELKKHFFVLFPKNYELNITSFEPKANVKKTGILKYTLSKKVENSNELKSFVSEMKTAEVRGLAEDISSDKLLIDGVNFDYTDNNKNSTVASSLTDVDYTVVSGTKNSPKFALTLNSAKSLDLAYTKAFAKTTVTFTKKSVNDTTGEIIVTVTATKDGATHSKDYTVSGFKVINATTVAESANVTLTKKSSTTQTAAEIKKAIDAATENEAKITKLKEYFDITIPDGYELDITSFEPKSDSSTEGELTYTLSKNVPSGANGTTTKVTSDSKVTTASGLTEDLSPSELLTDGVSFDYTGENKSSTVGSSLTDADYTVGSGTKISPKFTLALNSAKSSDLAYTKAFAKTTVTFTKKSVNDTTGEIIVTVTATKDGATHSKDYTVSGFKVINATTVAESANVTLTKKSSTTQTAAEIKKAIDAITDNATKITKLKEYFDITIPDGYELDITSFEPKADSSTEGELTYTLSKNVPSGANGTTTKVTSDSKVTTASGLTEDLSPSELLTDGVSFDYTGENKSSTVGSSLTDADYTVGSGTKISPKFTLALNSAKSSDLAYTKAFAKTTVTFTKKSVNDTTGEIIVTVTATKDGATHSKDYTVEGFKTFTSSDITGNVALTKKAGNNSTAAEIKTAIDAITDNAAKITKLKEYFDITIPDGYELDITSFEPKADSSTEGELTYTLSKNVPSGSGSTTKVTSDSKVTTASGLTKDLSPSELLTDGVSFDYTGENKSSTVGSSLTDADYTVGSGTKNSPKFALTLNSAKSSDLAYTKAFAKTTVTFTKKSVNDITGQVIITVTATKDGATQSKDYTVEGFKTFTSSDITGNVALAKKAGNNSTAAEIKAAIDAITDNAAKITKLKEYFDITIPDGYELDITSFEPKTGSNNEGELTYTLSKNVPSGSYSTTKVTSDSKVTTASGLTEDLSPSELLTDGVSFDYTGENKSSIAASSLEDDDYTVGKGTKNSPKFALTLNSAKSSDLAYTKAFAKTTVTFTKKYADDIAGEIVVTVIATKDGVTHSKDYTVSGFKVINATTVAEGVNVTLTKKAGNNLTAAEIKTAIDAAAGNDDKLTKLKEYFDVQIPEGYELEVSTFSPKADSNTEGILSYRLSKNVPAGDDGYTIEIHSDPKYATASGLKSSKTNDEINMEEIWDKLKFTYIAESEKPNTLPVDITKQKSNYSVHHRSRDDDSNAFQSDKFKLEINPDASVDSKLFNAFNSSSVKFENYTYSNIEGTLSVSVIINNNKNGKTTKIYNLDGFKKGEKDIIRNIDFFAEAINEPLGNANYIKTELDKIVKEPEETTEEFTTRQLSKLREFLIIHSLPKDFDINTIRFSPNSSNPSSADLTIIFSNPDNPSERKRAIRKTVTGLRDANDFVLFARKLNVNYLKESTKNSIYTSDLTLNDFFISKGQRKNSTFSFTLPDDATAEDQVWFKDSKVIVQIKPVWKNDKIGQLFTEIIVKSSSNEVSYTKSWKGFKRIPDIANVEITSGSRVGEISGKEFIDQYNSKSSNEEKMTLLKTYFNLNWSNLGDTNANDWDVIINKFNFDDTTYQNTKSVSIEYSVLSKKEFSLGSHANPELKRPISKKSEGTLQTFAPTLNPGYLVYGRDAETGHEKEGEGVASAIATLNTLGATSSNWKQKLLEKLRFKTSGGKDREWVDTDTYSSTYGQLFDKKYEIKQRGHWYEANDARWWKNVSDNSVNLEYIFDDGSNVLKGIKVLFELHPDDNVITAQMITGAYLEQPDGGVRFRPTEITFDGLKPTAELSKANNWHSLYAINEVKFT